MANTLITPDWVTYEVALYFVNELKGVAQFDRQYNDQYVVEGAKVGDTLRVRLPQQFEATDGAPLTVQDLLDTTKNLVLNRRRHVGFQWSSQEGTLDIDDARNRYVMPAAETLANNFDRTAMADVVLDVFNSAGAPGTTPTAALTYLEAKTKLLNLATPHERLCAVLEPWSQAVLSNNQSTLFNPTTKISENWETGMFADSQLGIDKWLMDQNMPRFTTGSVPAASTPVINGASQTGSSIITAGWGTGTALKKGDIVTFAGVHFVNPLSKEPVGDTLPAQFVLTADVSETAGAITLPISPAIVTTGALQNVNASPADGAAVTYWNMAPGGTYAARVSPQNMVFHKEAHAVVMADLVMPNGGAASSRVSSKQINVALRYVEQYNITSDQNVNRLDILFGSASIQERMSSRVPA